MSLEISVPQFRVQDLLCENYGIRAILVDNMVFSKEPKLGLFRDSHCNSLIFNRKVLWFSALLLINPLFKPHAQHNRITFTTIFNLCTSRNKSVIIRNKTAVWSGKSKIWKLSVIVVTTKYIIIRKVHSSTLARHHPIRQCRNVHQDSSLRHPRIAPIWK